MPHSTPMFSASLRDTFLREAARTDFDVVIIGGGITGAGCLRDAALRGMKAILLEREDFAAGTSGYSSKLIHGGLRYLETGELRLVYESLRERSVLLRTAPRLVRPLPFLYPVYPWHRRGLATITAGTYLYYALTGLRGDLPRPRRLDALATRAREPHLAAPGLSGSVRYYDAQTSDSDLTLAVTRSAWARGGYACNHANVVRLLENGPAVNGVVVRDELSGATHEIRGRWVVNATGPWSDQARAALGGAPDERLRLTKGVHVVLRPEFRLRGDAVLMISPRDQRVLFALPWMDHLMIGTTDTDYRGDPAQAAADEDDIAYLLEAYNAYFPGRPAARGDVLSHFAGIRPLIRRNADSPSRVSREHVLFTDRPGFLSVIGGKLTSYRAMAEEILDRLVRETPGWSDRFARCRTMDTPIEDVRAFHGADLSAADVEEMARDQMAATPADVVYRRSKVAYLNPKELARYEALIAKVLANHKLPT